MGNLDHLAATVPVPQGEISVKYVRRNGQLSADVTLPQGVTGWLSWGGQKLELHGGAQHLEAMKK